MILKYILFIAIGQVILYLLSNQLKLRLVPFIIFLIIITGYFFVLPKYFYPKINPNVTNCGMPILAINFSFWIIGGALTTIIHIGYVMIKKIIILEKQSKNLY